jgi:hypothetical protein
MKIWGFIAISGILVSFCGLSLLYINKQNGMVSYEMLGFSLLFSFVTFVLGWRLLRGWTNYKEKKQSDILDDL